MKFPIPDAALDDRLAILGTAGSGKTYLATTAMERLLGSGARLVAIDPLGVMWGLRLKADGATPSGFDLPIFGGAHGDLPLTENAGALIGETVATIRESCIVDLSELPTKSAERRFMTAFLEAIYRHTDRSTDPYHLIIDEADRFAPQKPPKGDETMLNRMEEIVRRGRVRGFIPWMITQRPAVLNKNVLSQADGLVMLKLTSSQDRDQVGAWIEGQADRTEGKAILGSLPAMQRGQGVVWIPGRGILETVQFPKKATFDSSSAPKRGERAATKTLKPLDLGKLKDRLSKVEAETKENDPRALKAEIARLNQALKTAATAFGAKQGNEAALQKEREAAHRHGHAEGYQLGWAEGWKTGHAAGCKAQMKEVEDVALAFTPEAPLPPKRIPAGKNQPSNITRNITAPSAPVSQRSIPKRTSNGSGETHLPPGERAVLIAAAQFDGVERDQLSVLTGYKRSSRDAYIARLQAKGFVEVSGRTISVTSDGEAALPADYEPLPTGVGLQEYWRERLPEGERKILEELIAAYPNAVPRADLDDATGYKRSSRDAYIARMKSKRLVETTSDGVRASETLF